MDKLLDWIYGQGKTWRQSELKQVEMQIMVNSLDEAKAILSRVQTNLATWNTRIKELDTLEKQRKLSTAESIERGRLMQTVKAVNEKLKETNLARLIQEKEEAKIKSHQELTV